jgi:hypothetical protein
MDPNTIQQIATEVVHRLLPYADPWAFWPIVSIITALVAGAGAWGGAFFKIKGENFATKQDFEGLQERLKATTELVEGIKSEVSQRDWAQREWTNLRRVKLEALVEKTHECEVYLNRRRHDAMDGKGALPERDPVDELFALAALYFRELENEVGRFAILCREQNMLVFDLAPAIQAAHWSHDAAAHQVALENFRGKWMKRYPELIAARRELVDAASSLLKRIMNLDEQTSPSEER